MKLVYAVCYAELQNAQAAEDATQAVFLILARKPPFQRGTTIAGWLYRTAKFVAKHARRAELRRGRMHSALEMMQMNGAYFDEPNREATQVLTDALGKLRAADRDALLLRFYQELSLAEVGAALGVSEEAARKRVTRGLDKLRVYFQSHEIPAAAALLASGILVPISFDARRAVLLHSISQSSMPGAETTVVTASTHQLTSEVMKSMFMTKLKLTTVSAVMLVGAISGASYVMAQGVGHGFSGQSLVLVAKADGTRLAAPLSDSAVKGKTGWRKTSKGDLKDMPQAIEVMKTADGGIAVRVARPGHAGMHRTHPADAGGVDIHKMK